MFYFGLGSFLHIQFSSMMSGDGAVISTTTRISIWHTCTCPLFNLMAFKVIPLLGLAVGCSEET
jgi:hypothetical protein